MLTVLWDIFIGVLLVVSALTFLALLVWIPINLWREWQNPTDG